MPLIRVMPEVGSTTRNRARPSQTIARSSPATSRDFGERSPRGAGDGSLRARREG
jgi:hypothetical protein